MSGLARLKRCEEGEYIMKERDPEENGVNKGSKKDPGENPMMSDKEDPADSKESEEDPIGEEGSQSRCGIIAIAGRPNVGKSTLLNNVVGMKVAAVTPKPQTTRTRTRGVVNHARGQLIFVDTPGVHVAKKALNKYIVDQAFEGMSDVDGIILMVDPRDNPRQPKPGLKILMNRISERAKGCLVVAINKIDTIKDRKRLLPLMAVWDELLKPTAIVPICATKGDGVDRLLDVLAENIPLGPHLFPDDMLTDRTERWLAGELIREQLTLINHQEIPYSLAVEIESFQEREDKGDVFIHAKIFVERLSQKVIVVGKDGARLKEVGIRSREKISEMLGRKCHLKLWVKVAPGWTDDVRGLRRVGYE